ncbi:uncharacterized protein OCT59_026315 [Rhizophagus irregularis]|uniref:Uncharacterized protein n=2 Tax=Rhizophagus irregularis TaxID=588596 RepID=U9TLY3_RHIID|nr:hypothetical protein GLOIN_2v1548441 [Rhizophagus irregularis DAOM 181602=DAOM 197198]EXX71143.1 hypothetical protein RirG_081020 [Rhizophagus irregularis DAOM 197198w]POG77392.1 hypothetical protein GLOIN_2v1548441 [Rhizophagus irregularis DAOM 181602=DAOM 197198]UZO05979.1 hypothetical protein OCT59_026315 [Rhizophagus irregularis]GBC17008.1 hypothetical protein GLOIN_2v1548441 [Rhizophagus irregularis DAOM 181602=DAOM 197198]|eukprot:XP_025184258.1 hypothetical protein GLOIN_2v1548441 [Rhizophagus irregularis DAOM 181602=DAOM 197198]
MEHTIKDFKYEIENVNDLRKKCEKALKVISNYGDFTINGFSIKKEELNAIITKWQNSYQELQKELEDWKRESKPSYETVALLCKKKKVECVFLRIYDSGEPGLLNCVSITRTYAKPGIMSKLLNKVFKHKSQRIFKQLAKSQPDTIAALILSKDDGLKVIWK